MPKYFTIGSVLNCYTACLNPAASTFCYNCITLWWPIYLATAACSMGSVMFFNSTTRHYSESPHYGSFSSSTELATIK